MSQVSSLLDVGLPEALEDFLVSLVGHALLSEIHEHLDQLNHAVGRFLVGFSPTHDVSDLSFEPQWILVMRNLRPVRELFELAADREGALVQVQRVSGH